MSRSRSDQRLVLLLWYASLVAEVVAWLALAMVIVIVVSLLNPQLAHGAVACQTAPAHRASHWTWREIDGRRCWYQGSRALPKSALHWVEREHRYHVDPPVNTDVVPSPPAAAPPLPRPRPDPQGLDEVLDAVVNDRELLTFFGRWLSAERTFPSSAPWWFTP